GSHRLLAGDRGRRGRVLHGHRDPLRRSSAPALTVSQVRSVASPASPTPRDRRSTIAGVVGTAGERPGLIGTSNALMSIYGFSSGNTGIVRETANPHSVAPLFTRTLNLN